MIELFSDTLELAELISSSEEARSYLKLKKMIQDDAKAKKIIKEFEQLKDRYEEAQRFGRFHPNYHEAKREAQSYQKQMFTHPLIGAYVEAEKKVDKLLYDVSCLLAQSVSNEILVPNDLWNRSTGGCKCK